MDGRCGLSPTNILPETCYQLPLRQWQPVTHRCYIRRMHHAWATAAYRIRHRDTRAEVGGCAFAPGLVSNGKADLHQLMPQSRILTRKEKSKKGFCQPGGTHSSRPVSDHSATGTNLSIMRKEESKKASASSPVSDHNALLLLFQNLAQSGPTTDHRGRLEFTQTAAAPLCTATCCSGTLGSTGNGPTHQHNAAPPGCDEVGAAATWSRAVGRDRLLVAGSLLTGCCACALSTGNVSQALCAQQLDDAPPGCDEVGAAAKKTRAVGRDGFRV